MFIAPTIYGDVNKLRELVVSERTRKENTARALGVDESTFGAGDRMNFQNLPRDNEIRDCLVAPPGYLIVDIDLSQIEYRVLCALAGQADKLEALRQGRDVYSELASKLYGFPVSKNDDDQKPREVGKTCTLSCGFGSGKDGKTFQQKLPPEKIKDFDQRSGQSRRDVSRNAPACGRVLDGVRPHSPLLDDRRREHDVRPGARRERRVGLTKRAPATLHAEIRCEHQNLPAIGTQ
jgi:hypothetical protein